MGSSTVNNFFSSISVNSYALIRPVLSVKDNTKWLSKDGSPENSYEIETK